MARQTVKLPSFSNVTAGATATLEFPLGLSYHQMLLQHSGVTLAQMKNIRLEIDGKVVQKWKDGTRLDQMNKHYGRGAAENGILPIFFNRSELDDPIQQRLFAFGTTGVKTMHLLIDISDDAQAPKLTASAIKGNAAPLGVITKIKTYPVSFATSGEHEIDKLPTPPGSRIAAIHLFSDKVTRCELDINSQSVFELDKAVASKIQSDYDRDPQDSVKMSLDFILEGDVSQAVSCDGVTDFRLRPTLNAPGAVDVVVEYIDQFAGI